MLTQKNKNKSFVFEEEFDQDNNEKISLKNESKTNLNSASNDQFETRFDFRDFLIRVEGEDIKLDNELANILYPYLKENVKDIKVKYRIN